MQKYYNINLITKVKQHIKNGGIIAYPTESCYGFGCDPMNRIAIKRLLQLKRRPRNKGLIIIASNLKQVEHMVMPLSLYDKTELNKYWPGFYSILLPVRENIPKILSGRHSKLAVRVSQHALVKQLCGNLGQALISTSANYSGCKTIKTYRECARQFGQKYDMLILPGLTNFIKRPSTILDWKTKQVLR